MGGLTHMPDVIVNTSNDDMRAGNVTSRSAERGFCTNLSPRPDQRLKDCGDPVQLPVADKIERLMSECIECLSIVTVDVHVYKAGGGGNLKWLSCFSGYFIII